MSRQFVAPPRIVIEAKHGRVEATLWLDDVAVDGHSDSTGTLTTRQLVAPLIERFDQELRDVRDAIFDVGTDDDPWGNDYA